MENKEVYDSLAVLFDPDQLRSIVKSLVTDPDQRLWMSILLTSLNDWSKFRAKPNKHTWKNAQDIPSWVDTESFELIAGLISMITGTPEEEFHERFIRWLGPIEWEDEPSFLVPTLYICNICSGIIDDTEISNHLEIHDILSLEHINRYIKEI